MALEETRQRLGDALRLLAEPAPGEGVISATLAGDLRPLLGLQTIFSAYSVVTHPTPRPRGLLGHQHFTRLLAQIEAARRLAPAGSYQSLYLSAAGAESAVLTRLKDELASALDLQLASHEGDLLLRLRRPPDGSPGWQTLVRLSPRPLATRPWRACNYEGALNAAVAHAMCRLTRPSPDDHYLNLACGSGSLLIERLACAPARRVVGVDIAGEALACARQNLAQTRRGGMVRLVQADAAELPFPTASFDVLTADLPFGHLVGTHQANLENYPRWLDEAARLLRPGGRLCLITHEVRLTQTLLTGDDRWRSELEQRVWLGGLHPRLFLLTRTTRR